MAHMGYGYGSECHLLRWMGRHRVAFDSAVRQALAKPSGATNWLDFHFAPGQTWADAEWKGLDFIEDPVIQDAWRNWWPQGRGIHNWDAVGWWGDPADKEPVLVEAKAHLEEFYSSCDAKPDGGLPLIMKSLTQTANSLGVANIGPWLKPHYQLANRLAIIRFLSYHGYKPHLVLLYFVGNLGGTARVAPQTPDDWRDPLAQRKQQMGLPPTHALSAFVHELLLHVSEPSAWLGTHPDMRIAL